MKEFKFKTSFAELQIKPIVSEDKDKLLALASLQELGKFLPNIDTVKNVDLLPVAFNACVINRVNKNEDVIDTATALAVYKEFINKPINIEHNRQRVIGVILTAGFTAFGSDASLTEEEVKNFNQPFNIVLGGLVWRIVNPDLADLIEESNDPTSSNYMEISASWELGFSDYQIIELNSGDKNISGGRIIADASEINKLNKDLRCNGGSGKIDGDKRIYRMPVQDVLPLGIGFTEKPAAEVQGIAVPPQLPTEKSKEGDTEATLTGTPDFNFGVCPNCNLKTSQYSMNGETGYVKCDTCGEMSPKEAWNFKSCVEKTVQAGQDSTPQHFINKCSCGKTISSCRCSEANKTVVVLANACKDCSEKQKNISQIDNSNVKIERKQVMAIKSIQDITDESLKQISASAVAEFLSSELKKANDSFQTDKAAALAQKEEVNQKLVASEQKATELENKLKEVEATIAQLNQEKANREAVEKFNARMAKVNEAYELDDEVRATIAEEVKAIASDDDFSKWEKKANILLKGFAKKTKDDQAAKDKAAKDKEDSKDGGKDDDKEDKSGKLKSNASVVDNAIDNGKKDGGLPNSSSASQPSMIEKYKSAFAIENFVVTKR